MQQLKKLTKAATAGKASASKTNPASLAKKNKVFQIKSLLKLDSSEDDEDEGYEDEDENEESGGGDEGEC